MADTDTYMDKESRAQPTNERGVMNLYKRRSETPLQTIERYIAKFPKYKDEKMTYAGRLDPMAEGVLIVLVGEKTKDREKYTSLDKDYEFEFILGVETDTFDVLGKITSFESGKNGNVNEINIDKVRQAAEKYIGNIKQSYPAYSSKVVGGKQLFQIAREGKIHEIELPTHDVVVNKLEISGTRVISRSALHKEITDAVEAVSGDFRQREIMADWDKYFSKEDNSTSTDNIVVYKAVISCGSGFYVRQLVADIGKDLGTGAVTVSIKRTRVGGFDIKDSFDF